ncbi:TVP38/TMEM64 family protein [Clostridium autoethanogenum]|uniref:TVP38/TMEM64 family membrane protein n=4 Tax=Clostridium TaxID=1485 RepID=A0A162LGZ4_9CLOT|nr:Hypothetical protein CLAU_2345 [Clostridium autoethanogenum DSM 10061]OAA93386.1 TVP38/TMEM64 family inner membrane protein YdjZ [Clostridium coskatii]OBR92476.1 TVP38/TMEM64 family inner membrane protein YdjZ [Clostridium coskatii]OVY50537.1 TVP38/TMEM64 family inner membrane protein YdjZ [Clostridium autoethanogenum]RMD04856.1 TVP38/TMEM64 family protein [Clostridium autoethanogenum]
MRNSKESIFKCLIVFFLVFTIIFILYKYKGSLYRISMDSIRSYIQSYGKFSDIIFILIYTIRPVVIILPASLMSIIAGSIFNSYMALLLSMIGCFGSATLAFFLSRFLGRSFVNKILKGKALTLNDNIEKYGFRIMTAMRLSFVFPYDPLSYAAGLTKIKYRDFIFGTLVGILPEMVTYSLIGGNLTKPFSFKFILPIIVLFIIACISIYMHKKKSKDTNNL